MSFGQTTSKTKASAMGFFRKRRRKMNFESLNDRIVLSANAIANVVGASGDGDVATVTQDGSEVSIIGSDNADTIDVQLGASMYQVTVNGDTTEYNVDAVDQIVIEGDGGADLLTIVGSDLDDRAELKDGTFTVTNSSVTVSVTEVEDVSATAGAGANRAFLFDTAGDDVLTLRPDEATLVDGSGNSYKVEGFDRVIAVSENGGSDQANFYDTTGDDVFVAKESFSYLVGTGFWNYARGFEKVDAFSEQGGSDQAWLFDSSGDDTLTAADGDVTLTHADGTVFASHNFSLTKGVASDGSDTATMTGQENIAERFVWSPETAQLSTSGSDSMTYIAEGFDTMSVTGGDVSDRADLRGSESDDAVIMLPEATQLTTPDADIVAIGFGTVVARGNGGNDFAHMEDSRFNDNIVTKARYAYLQGSNFLNLATGFEVLDIASINGGYDRAVSYDYADDIDFLVWDGPQYWIFGQNRNERIFQPSHGRGFGIDSAGWETLRENEIPFRLSGSHSQVKDLSAAQLAEIATRNETPVANYVLVDGQLVKVLDAASDADANATDS